MKIFQSGRSVPLSIDPEISGIKTLTLSLLLTLEFDVSSTTEPLAKTEHEIFRKFGFQNNYTVLILVFSFQSWNFQT